MRLYKPKYTNKKGVTKEAKKYWVELRDHLGRIRRFPALTSKTQSEIFGRQIERLVNCRAAGEQPNPKLTAWLTQIPQKLKDRFVEIGILDKSKAVGSKPLSEHLRDYEILLRAKLITVAKRREAINSLRRIFKECGFKYWRDISADKVDAWLVDAPCLHGSSSGPISMNRKMSAQSQNGYISHAKRFCKWMVNANKAPESPLKSLVNRRVAGNRRRIRRALTIEEARRLIATTKAAPRRDSGRGKSAMMSPPERALLWKFAIESGIRRSEIRSLKVSSFNFEACTVTIDAKHSKHRKEDVVTLRPDTAAELKQFFRDNNKLPTAKAFNMPYDPLYIFKQDLERAGIEYIDADGRYLDFHSLRYTTGTLLAASGVHPKVAQSIMRHSDINLTMSLYTHTLRGQESDAVQQLPDLNLDAESKEKGAGNSA